MQTLIRLYFVYIHFTFPVISEWDTYRLLHPMAASSDGEHMEPMSLAMLNAVLFSASAVSVAASTVSTAFISLTLLQVVG